jgi:predicted enzyme related to lactoylglutathione lyase
MKLDSAVVYTNDLKKVTEFYRDFVGLTFEYETPGRFVQFAFENGVKLGIKKAIEDREKPGTGTIFIQAEEVEKLYLKFKESGAKFLKELKVETWGTEFAILDPDGNKVVFVKRT